MILGIDASTNVCGWSFAESGSVLDAGFIDTSKLETNKDKCFKIIQNFQSNPFISKINHINLEAPLFGFGFGRTSQQTIIKLIKFNGLLEYLLSEELKITVNLINVNTARKKVLGKARVKGMTGKEFVKEQLPNKIPNIHKFDIINKRGNVDKKIEDVWDAIVCSLYD